jgi:hypothetical protein
MGFVLPIEESELELELQPDSGVVLDVVSPLVDISNIHMWASPMGFPVSIVMVCVIERD